MTEPAANESEPMPMPPIDAFSGQRSIRRFPPNQIAMTKLHLILATAARSASRVNAQPWLVHVLTGATRDRLSGVVPAAAVRGALTLLNSGHGFPRTKSSFHALQGLTASRDPAPVIEWRVWMHDHEAAVLSALALFPRQNTTSAAASPPSREHICASARRRPGCEWTSRDIARGDARADPDRS